MATSYAATFSDVSGQVRLEGTIDYTQPTVKSPMAVRNFPFTYQTTGLATGYTLFTPAVGDYIYDIGIVITTAFNGTTPKLDVGTFSSTTGVFKQLAGNPVDGTKLYATVTSNTGLQSSNSGLWLSTAIISVGTAGTAAIHDPQLYVSAASPILLVASQDGTKGGTAITSTAGVGFVVVVYSTQNS